MNNLLDIILKHMYQGEYKLGKKYNTKIIELLNYSDENMNAASELGLLITGLDYRSFRDPVLVEAIWEIPAGARIYFERKVDYINNLLTFRYENVHFEVPINDLLDGTFELIWDANKIKKENKEELIVNDLKKGSLVYLKEKKDETMGVVLELLDENNIILLCFADKSFRIVDKVDLLECSGGIDRGINAFITNLHYIANLSREEADFYKDKYQTFLFCEPLSYTPTTNSIFTISSSSTDSTSNRGFRRGRFV